ncbi:hypothetical protein NLM33_41475 [Bradyrhizobium sp. CCGUVB1N3]|uniref:hypothetical protein n=1 Tax=Bradyrhizobium sp. CCGUVB1N3 TaxID=2949629 RepID=UPI0020B1E25A|nr:hypothetical protein [Bradyrhizobium sp. CCGUVB1N3]MCP3476647.1 hypothetical protein [Bradyrhizobium sp. CCGUVB1N3]
MPRNERLSTLSKIPSPRFIRVAKATSFCCGTYQREIGHEYAHPFWNILVNENVLACLCSHILAFDVQAHRGVLQMCTAGAGTTHRMPGDVEYLHCVQAALDERGIRYQVLDIDGAVRERMDGRYLILIPPNGWNCRSDKRKRYSVDMCGADPESS